MLSRIELDGYRLLDGFSADLGDLTVVIGSNAVGKSTLLDALQLIAQCADGPINSAMSWHWGLPSLLNATTREQRVAWRVTFGKPAHLPWSTLPLDDSLRLLYEVAIKGDIQGQAQADLEILRKPQPMAGYTEAFKYLESTPYRRQIYSRDSHKLVPFDEAVPSPALAKEDGPAAEGVPVPAFVAREPALLLSQIRFFNEFPVPSSARMLLAGMAFYPGFDVTRFSNLRSKAAEIKPVTLLVSNGENLGTVLHEILTRYDFRNAASDLRQFLSAAYPAFEEIHCDTTYGTPAQVLVRVREKGMLRSMELWELSDGMLRFLCLACALLNPVPPPLVAVDEPESGLHPRLLPIVADMIKAAAERTQVLVTTHSPDLLGRFEVSDIAVMTRPQDAPRTRWHRPANRPSLLKMIEGIAGETVGDLLRSGELEAMG